MSGRAAPFAAAKATSTRHEIPRSATGPAVLGRLGKPDVCLPLASSACDERPLPSARCDLTYGSDRRGIDTAEPVPMRAGAKVGLPASTLLVVALACSGDDRSGATSEPSPTEPGTEGGAGPGGANGAGGPNGPDGGGELDDAGDGGSAPFSVVHADIGGNMGLDVFAPWGIFVDGRADALLVIGSDASQRPTLRRCKPDGSACTAHLLDPSRGVASAPFARAAIDGDSRALLVVSEDRSWHDPSIAPWEQPSRLSLFRCSLDNLVACSFRDITTGIASPFPRWVGVDATARKLLVATCDRLLRCNLDGTDCAATDLRLGAAVCGQSYAIDPLSQKLVFSTHERDAAGPDAGGEASTISIARCNLDGTSCTRRVVATLVAPNDRIGGIASSLVVDTARSKLLVVFHDHSGPIDQTRLSLARCNLDATGCTRGDLPGSVGGYAPVGLVAGQQLLVTSSNDTAASLLRCTADGTSCTRTTLGASYAAQALGYDEARDRALVLASSTVSEYRREGGNPVQFGTGHPVAVFSQARDGATMRSDVSGGFSVSQYVSWGRSPAMVDTAGGQLLFLAEAVGVARVLTRCNLDGSACASTPALRAREVLGAIDGVAFLLGIQDVESEVNAPMEIVRCDPGAPSCTAFATPGKRAKLDAKHRQIIAVWNPYEGEGSDRVYRCPLDGSACGGPVELPVGYTGDFVLDDASDALIFPLASQRILRCARDGSNCSVRDLSAGQPLDGPSKVFVDDGALTVVTVVAPHPQDVGVPGRAAVFRCNPDATGCTRSDLPIPPDVRFDGASTVLDARTRSVQLAFSAQSRLYRPSVLSCDVDGRACRDVDLSAGLLPRSGTGPTALLDAPSRRLLLVATDETNLGRARLFRVTLP
jgi:hypothetical protein